MPLPNQKIGIAKNIRTVEWLKAELVSGTGELMRGLVRGAEDKILDSLAGIVVTAYILAERLGIGFATLDAKIASKVKANIEQSHEIEEWFGDFSALARYSEEIRGDNR
ncbi:MAG: hypothetical protein GX030_03365 [Firmicutes bacterium]|nr:hypothetical protein [Bacillota bacterium]